MKKRWIGLILAGGLVAASLGSSVSAFAATPTGSGTTASTGGTAAEAESSDYGIVTGYSLELTGTTPYESGMYENYEALLNGYQLVFENGTYSDELYDIDDYGEYYALRTESYDDEVNATGFFAADGEQLIPYEAAFVDWVDTNISEWDEFFPHRYLSVTYSDGETDDESEAYFYLTSSYLTLSPGEDDVLYKGHGKIYDTETRQFVPGIELTDPSLDIYECGDAIVIGNGGVLTMYDADGKELLTSESGSYNSAYDAIGNGILVLKDDWGYAVYDDTGAKLFESKNALSVIDSANGYIKMYDSASGLYSILDSNGNQLMDLTFKSVNMENGIGFRVKTEEDVTQLISKDGEVIAETDDSYGFTEYIAGYATLETDDTYSLYGPSGLIAEELLSYSYDLYYLYEANGSFLVLNTGENKVPEASLDTSIGTGLLRVEDESSGLYGLYDLFTGEQLLDCSYKAISATSTHIYARADDTWEIYSLDPIFAE